MGTAAQRLLARAFSPMAASAPPGQRATSQQLWHGVCQLPPPMIASSHKGQCGRIGVVGGSKAYTGAPYFAAATTLKLGVDLTTVFCSVEASVPLKSYSPDLMVRPCLYPAHLGPACLEELAPTTPQQKKETLTVQQVPRLIVQEMDEWTAKMNSIVIGPGLGKDPLIVETVGAFLRHVRDQSDEHPLPLVIDGDGIHVLIEHADLFPPTSAPSSDASSSSAAPASTFHSHILLTPNAMEFRRLWTKFLPDEKTPDFDVDVEGQKEFLQSSEWRSSTIM
jgi:NAD(P)H-hydrate repair Nnr-like enzyme with NAD(P)H-hydrate dehydratase domain